MSEIDRILPSWDIRTAHATVVQASAARALAAALAAPAAPDPIVRALLRLRGLPPDGSVEELLGRIGFTELQRGPDEVVYGASGRPWHAAERLTAFADASDGAVRLAASFRAEPLGDGRVRLVTETRVSAVDDAARRRFRRYWRIVGPFSSFIRRRWLARIRRSLAS